MPDKDDSIDDVTGSSQNQYPLQNEDPVETSINDISKDGGYQGSRFKKFLTEDLPAYLIIATFLSAVGGLVAWGGYTRYFKTRTLEGKLTNVLVDEHWIEPDDYYFKIKTGNRYIQLWSGNRLCDGKSNDDVERLNELANEIKEIPDNRVIVTTKGSMGIKIVTDIELIEK